MPRSRASSSRARPSSGLRPWARGGRRAPHPADGPGAEDELANGYPGATKRAAVHARTLAGAGPADRGDRRPHLTLAERAGDRDPVVPVVDVVPVAAAEELNPVGTV